MVTRADTGDATPAGTNRRWGRDRASAAGDAEGASAPAGEPAGGVAAEVVGVVRATLDTIARAGTVSAAGVSDAVETAGRSLTRRVVAGAAREHRHVGDRAGLARALAERPATPAFASATSAAMALKFAGRFKRLGFLAKRTPAFLVATAIPALVASVARGADELGMVASHLVHRARAEGVEPDVERVRRAAVQLVSLDPVDPEVEPRHGALVYRWLRRAVRAALPFTAGVATADPEGLAEATAEVDVTRLGAA